MIDPFCDTWKDVKKWADKGLVAARAQLESPGLDIDETNRLRGRIETFKDFSALTDEKPEIPNAGSEY